MQGTGNPLVDSMMVSGYDVPDAHPATVTNDGNKATTEYKIPLAVWMVVFLVAGYIGLRMLLDD